VRDHLLYHGRVYVVYTFLVIAIVLTVFHRLSLPEPNERIVVFYAGTDIDPDRFETDLFGRLDQPDATTITDVEFQYIDASAAGFEEILATKSIGDTDLCILPLSAIKVNTGTVHFLPLTAPTLTDLFGSDLELYSEGGVVYGLILNPEGIENRFTTYLDETNQEIYVLFVNTHSVNVGGLNSISTDADVHAIESIRWFLEEGDE